MTTRFPPANLPGNMVPFRKALENTLSTAENAQDNAESVTNGMKQSVASNYGLGSRLPTLPASLSNKVYTSLLSNEFAPASTTLQRAWTNLGTFITMTTPGFVSNVALAVAGTTVLDITGGAAGGTYLYFLRANVSGAFSATKWIPIQNYGQTLFTATNVPASTNVQIRLQIWGFIQNPDNSFVNGTIGTSSVVRISGSMRAIALV